MDGPDSPGIIVPCDAPLATGIRGRAAVRSGWDDVLAGSPSMATAADRQLIFELLALQNGLINQGQLLAGFQAWTLEKMSSLGFHALLPSLPSVQGLFAPGRTSHLGTEGNEGNKAFVTLEPFCTLSLHV